MSKFSLNFGRTVKRKPSLVFPHVTVLPALVAKAKPEQNWRELYEASLLERDRAKLPERVRAARDAIHQRLAREKETLSWEEHAEINDALRALVRRWA
jgi:hypothetical protein